MKTFLIAIGALVFLSATAMASSESIIRDRAKALSNQNSNRQLETPAPAAARPTTPPAAAPAVPTDPFQRLKIALGAIKTNSTVSGPLKQEIANDLMALARKGSKPSPANVTKLANDLSSAFAEKELSTAHQMRLTQNLVAVLNSSVLSPAQRQAILEDVQNLLGSQNSHTAAVTGDLKSIMDETQKPASN